MVSEYRLAQGREPAEVVLERSPIERGELDAQATALFRAADDDRTAPLPIVAPRRLGDTDITIFPIALGASRLAGLDDHTAARVMGRFLGRGGTLIDLASQDGSGRSEELIGEWLEHARLRDRVTLAVRLDPNRDELGIGTRSVEATALVRSVHTALRRLRTDRIELLVVDLRAPGVGLEESLMAADGLISAGVVHHLAAVGARADELLAARVLASGGMPRLEALLAPWDVIRRDGFEGELRMVAAAQGLAVLPDASLAAGLLAPPPVRAPARGLPALLGRGRPAPQRAVELLGRGRQHRIALALDRVADELAIEPTTAALAWLMAKRNVAAPIVSAGRPEQLDAVMDAAAVRLSRAQMLELDRAGEQ